MSWHYLQEGVADFSLQSYLGSIPDAQSKLGVTQGTAFSQGKEMELSTSSQFGMMYQHSTDSRGEVKSTLLQAGSHARTSALRGKGLEFMEVAADFGKSIQESLGKLGLILSLPKTPLYSELGALVLSCKTFPRWGMMQDGVCLELGISAKFTRETGCGYLPTPSGVNGGKNKNHIAGRLDEWGGSSNPFRKTEIGRVHCPRFEEWMMGWPETWAAQTGFEMDKYQLWLHQHSEYFHVD